MDASASACSIIHSFGYSSCAIPRSAYNNKCSPKSQERLQYLPSLPHSTTSLTCIDILRPIIRNCCRFVACSSSSTNPDRNPNPEIAVLLEVDGKGAGDEERMIALFFNRIGWPTSLPTSEKETFMKSILQEKKKAMDDFILSKECSLRPGVERFIDDALNDSLPVVILAAPSERGEEFARATIKKLGIERISKLKIIGNEEIEESMYVQLVRGQATFSGLDEELAKEANKAVAAEKKKIAKEVASMLKLRVDINSRSTESLQGIIAALHAAAEYAEVPFHKCVLVAGSLSVVGAAERIGMPCIIVRNSLTYGAEFPSAKAVYDGFGDVDLTIPKLRRKLFS